MVFPFLSAIRVFALACVVTAVVPAASAQEGERSPGGLFDRIFGGSERFGGAFEALELQHDIRARRRGTLLARLGGRLRRALAAAEAFGAAEDAIEQAARGPFALLRGSGGYHRRYHAGEREYPDRAEKRKDHEL